MICSAAVAALAVVTASLHIEPFIGQAHPDQVAAYTLTAEGDVLILDVPASRDEAVAFAEAIRGRGGTVRRVFLTHADARRWGAIAYLQEAFAEVRVIASPRVAARMNAQRPPGATAIASHLAKELRIGSTKASLLSFSGAASEHTDVLWFRRGRQLFTGDLVVAGAHLPLDSPGTSPEAWARALTALGALGAQKVFPGAGRSGGPQLLSSTRAYLQYFAAARARARGADELESMMRARFPALTGRDRLKAAALRFLPHGAAGAGGVTPQGPTRATPPMRPPKRTEDLVGADGGVRRPPAATPRGPERRLEPDEDLTR